MTEYAQPVREVAQHESDGRRTTQARPRSATNSRTPLTGLAFGARPVIRRAEGDEQDTAEPVSTDPGGSSGTSAVAVATRRPTKLSKIRKERRGHEQARMWAERIQSRLPDISLADATTLCEGLVGSSLSVVQAEALAQLVVDGWSPAHVASLGRRFVGNKGGLTLTDWLRIAGRLVDRPDDAATFARVGNGWTPTSSMDLAGQFAQDSGGITAADWARIARTAGALLNRAEDVAAFARMANRNPDAKLSLALAYAAAPPGRSARNWVSLAKAAPGLVNGDVADFAQAPASWSTPKLAGLVGRFAKDPGGRTAADWVSLAGAHDAVTDQDEAIALAARAAWTATDLQRLSVTALATGVPGPDLAGYLATRNAAGALRGMITGGWAPGRLGTFLGTLLGNDLSPASITRCLDTPNMAAATLNMHAAWPPAGLAEFVTGALSRATPNATLAALMSTPNFPASSRALVQGTWTPRRVGEYSGQAGVGGASGAQVDSLASTAQVPARLRAMTTAGWTQADLGAFTAAMQLGAVADATIETLLRQPKFRSGSLKMHKAKWRPNLNGAFVAGALGSGLSVQLLSILVDEAGFDAASRKWLTPGWTANEVGRIAGKARQEGLIPSRLTAFLDTANAATSAFALKASWGADEVGKTVGYCRTQARPPTDAQMERLLFFADTAINGAQIQPGWVRIAAEAATGGKPTWAQVIARVPTFQANWAGTRNNANGPSVTWAGLRAGGGAPYRIKLRIPGSRITHVEQGHTWEHFQFTYPNCTRAVGSTFFAVGTNVRNLLQALLGDPAVRDLAENAAENAAFNRTLDTQGPAQNCTVGVLSNAPGPGYNPISDAHISQCYPNAGTDIASRDLVAIGRYFGQF